MPLSAAALRRLLWRPPPPAARCQAPLSAWTFAVEVRREDRILWRVALSACHVVQVGPQDTATLLERVDIVLPGDIRRLSVAGACAALAGAAKAGTGPPEGHWVSVVAVDPSRGRVVHLPGGLALGSRWIASDSPPRSAGSALTAHSAGSPMAAIAGLAVQQVVSGKGQRHPTGSVEVRLGLAFLGPDGCWLRGGALAAAALLEAAAAWSMSPP